MTSKLLASEGVCLFEVAKGMSSVFIIFEFLASVIKNLQYFEENEQCSWLWSVITHKCQWLLPSTWELNLCHDCTSFVVQHSMFYCLMSVGGAVVWNVVHAQLHLHSNTMLQISNVHWMTNGPGNILEKIYVAKMCCMYDDVTWRDVMTIISSEHGKGETLTNWFYISCISF